MSKLITRKSAVITGVVIFLIVGGLTTVYLMYHQQVRETIRTEVLKYIREKADLAVEESGGGSIDITFSSFDYGFFTQALDINGVRVRYSDSTEQRGERLDLTARTVECTSVSPIDVIWGGGLTLGDIYVDSLDIDYRIWNADTIIAQVAEGSSDTVYAGLPSVPNLDSLLNTLAIGILPPDIAPLKIDGIHITNASIRDEDDRSGGGYAEEFGGIDIHLTSIALGEEANIRASVVGEVKIDVATWHREVFDELNAVVHNCSILVNDQDSSLSVGSAEYRADNGMNAIVSGVTFSFAEQRIGIDSFDVRPSMSDKEFFASSRYRQDRFILFGKNVELRNIDLDGLTAGKALTVEQVSVDTFTIDVYSSLIGVPSPAQRNPEMPYDMFKKIPYDVTIDSINVNSAVIKFAEMHPNNPRPGRMFWNEVNCSVYGVTTSADLQAKAPLTIRATGMFFGKSPMNATISVPLDSRTFKLKASGGMGGFDITLLNNFIPYADNVRIKSGSSASSSFNINVVGRKCTGSVDPVYTNLDVELVTPEAKETNIFTDVASWAANTFVVKNDNPLGEDHVIGKVEYTLPKNAAIMQRLWFPIRDGIGDAAGF